MSARVFVHPRCYTGPAEGALAAYLQGCGYDLKKIAVIPAHQREVGRAPAELVRKIDEQGAILHFERMDGTRGTYRMGQVDMTPEAA